MGDTFAEGFNNTLGQLVLTNVKVFNLVEGFQVLE